MRWMLVLLFLVAQDPPARFQDRLMGRMPEGCSLLEALLSPDGRRAAFRIRDGSAQRVLLGTEAGESFDKIHRLTWSPDGRRLAYAAERGAKHFIVVGTTVSAEFDEVSGPVFAPDGRAIWYGAKDGAGRVTDGAEQVDCVIEDTPEIGPGGKAFFAGRQGDRSWIFVGGKKLGAEHANVRRPVHDGKTSIAYIAVDREGKERVVVDGAPHGAAWRRVSSLQFHPRDGSVLYVGTRDRRDTLVIAGREAGTYDSIDIVLPLTGKDPVGLIVKEKGRSLSVVGERKSPGFDSFRVIAWTSPQASRFAWIGIRDNRDYLVVEDRAFGPFDGFGGLAWSADDKALAFLGITGEKTKVLVDGRESGEYDGVAGLVFAGSDVAFLAASGGKSFLVVAGRKGEEFDGMADAAWSADGKQVAYYAAKDSALMLVTPTAKIPLKDGRWCPPAWSPDGKQVEYGSVEGRDYWMRVAASDR